MITIQFTVWCDNCSQWDYVDGKTVAQARKNAKQQHGYKLVDDKLLCKECQRKYSVQLVSREGAIKVERIQHT